MHASNLPEDDEWEDDDVAELLSCIRRRHKVTAERSADHVYITFNEGGETFRYEWVVGGSNQWLHVRRDGEWEQVWEA